MVRRKEEMKVRNVEHARGGNGTVTFTDFIVPEDIPGHGRLVSKLEIPPGSSIGEHQHEGEFEAFYILEGEALIHDNGEDVTLHPGDLHICKNGNTHGIENRSEKGLALLAMILNDLENK